MIAANGRAIVSVNFTAARSAGALSGLTSTAFHIGFSHRPIAWAVF